LLATNIQDAQRHTYIYPITQLKAKMDHKFRKIPSYLANMKQRVEKLMTQSTMPDVIALAVELLVASKHAQPHEYSSFEVLRSQHSEKTWWSQFLIIHGALESALKNASQANVLIAKVIEQIEMFYGNNPDDKLTVYKSLKSALKILKDDYPETALIYYQIIKEKIAFMENPTGLISSKVGSNSKIKNNAWNLASQPAGRTVQPVSGHQPQVLAYNS
jgi:hypothetical protein